MSAEGTVDMTAGVEWNVRWKVALDGRLRLNCPGNFPVQVEAIPLE